MDITYRFVASGQDDVEKAFTGIERAARRQKQAVEQATRATRQATSGGGGGGGASGGRRGVSETERLALRVAAAQERQAAREVRAAERAASAKARIEERANTLRVRAEERVAAAKARTDERNRKFVAGIRDRYFADEQRREERAAREKVRTTERAAKEAARKKVRAAERAAKEAARKEKKERDAAEKRSQTSVGDFFKAKGALRDLATGTIFGGLATAGVAGSALIGSAAGESMQLQEAAARIAISARGAGQKARDPNELRRGFEATAMATPGQSAAGIADAVARFVSLTGDLDTAVKSQGTFATIASASGANVGDVAEAAASLSQQFDVKGIEDMRDALAALTFQGKNGAFELKDAASQFQRLAASGASFGIPRGVGGVKILGGLTQIARTGTGSAEQATTAVENLLTNLKTKQKQLGAEDVKVFDKSGKARDVRDLIVESISKVGKGDMAKKSAGLTSIFGEQGIRAINPLIAKYSEKYRNTEGTEAQKTAAAVAVLREEFTKAIDAPGDYADVQEDAALAQEMSSAQLSAAWESLKSKVAADLLPSLGKLAESLNGKESLLDPFIEAVGLGAEAVVWFAKETGFVKRKSKAEILADEEARANKAAAAFDKSVYEKQGTGPLTKEQQAARDSLFIGRDNAYRDMWGLDESDKSKNNGPMSRDDFIAQYRAAGDGNQGEAAAEVVADKAKQNSMFNNDWFMRNFANETDNQRDVRHRYQAEGQAEKSIETPVNTQDIQAALAAAAEAAKNAAAAMNKVGAAKRGSIVSGVAS